jgi:non-specific serine/threonine protein kinase
MAYLDTYDGKRSANVASITQLTYVDISSQALALASEECQEHFRLRLTSIVVKRLIQSNRRFAEQGQPAQQAAGIGHATIELSLVDDPPPPRS